MYAICTETQWVGVSLRVGWTPGEPSLFQVFERTRRDQQFSKWQHIHIYIVFLIFLFQRVSGRKKTRLDRGGVWKHEAFFGHEMRGPAGTRRFHVSMSSGRQGQGAEKQERARGSLLPSSPSFFSKSLFYFCFVRVSMKEDASENLLYICIYVMIYLFHFITFYLILLIFLSKIYLMFDLFKT